MIFKAQTEWVKPTEFPDLRNADEIVIAPVVAAVTVKRLDSPAATPSTYCFVAICSADVGSPAIVDVATMLL